MYKDSIWRSLVKDADEGVCRIREPRQHLPEKPLPVLLIEHHLHHGLVDDLQVGRRQEPHALALPDVQKQQRLGHVAELAKRVDGAFYGFLLKKYSNASGVTTSHMNTAPATTKG
jgi:hypothetical protein